MASTKRVESDKEYLTDILQVGTKIVLFPNIHSTFREHGLNYDADIMDTMKRTVLTITDNQNAFVDKAFSFSRSSKRYGLVSVKILTNSYFVPINTICKVSVSNGQYDTFDPDFHITNRKVNTIVDKKLHIFINGTEKNVSVVVDKPIELGSLFEQLSSILKDGDYNITKYEEIYLNYALLDTAQAVNLDPDTLKDNNVLLLCSKSMSTVCADYLQNIHAGNERVCPCCGAEKGLKFDDLDADTPDQHIFLWECSACKTKWQERLIVQEMTITSPMVKQEQMATIK